jgi:hypothetical protein
MVAVATTLVAIVQIPMVAQVVEAVDLLLLGIDLAVVAELMVIMEGAVLDLLYLLAAAAVVLVL